MPMLLDIVDIMFARRITDDTPGAQIEEHHTNFTLLYPDQSEDALPRPCATNNDGVH